MTEREAWEAFEHALDNEAHRLAEKFGACLTVGPLQRAARDLVKAANCDRDEAWRMELIKTVSPRYVLRVTAALREGKEPHE